MNEDASRSPGLDRGCVQVYTGDGKGKTTAALGLALRAAGAGLRVFIAQFMKTHDTSEMRAMERFGDQVEWRCYGTGEFVHDKPSPREIEAAQRGLEEVREALVSGAYDVVILDEAGVAAYFEVFPDRAVLDLIDARPNRVELVVTGRRTPQEILDRADLVTEMRLIRHYYNAGIEARRGIEE